MGYSCFLCNYIYKRKGKKVPFRRLNDSFSGTSNISYHKLGIVWVYELYGVTHKTKKKKKRKRTKRKRVSLFIVFSVFFLNSHYQFEFSLAWPSDISIALLELIWHPFPNNFSYTRLLLIPGTVLFPRKLSCACCC